VLVAVVAMEVAVEAVVVAAEVVVFREPWPRHRTLRCEAQR